MKTDSTCSLPAFEDLSMAAGAFVYDVRISLDRFATQIAGHIRVLITAKHPSLPQRFLNTTTNILGCIRYLFLEKYCVDCKLHRRPPSAFSADSITMNYIPGSYS